MFDSFILCKICTEQVKIEYEVSHIFIISDAEFLDVLTARLGAFQKGMLAKWILGEM